ncbi:MAG TPA: thymidylate synthase [Solirubrobacteraceae bacterium]|nr:thymidylate synthase [Solirubrobacteraceae bacterium]
MPQFQALYHRELLHQVNPAGDVGLLTLWSPLRSVTRRLESISAEILDAEHSRVVAMANLYGDGMYAMFCNLLYNPQVRHLIAIGEDIGLPTCREIEAFLAVGLEDTVMLGMAAKRIVGTERVFFTAPEFDEQRLRRQLSFRYLGRLSSATLDGDLSACLRDLPQLEDQEHGERVRVPIGNSAAGEQSHRPSDPASHQVLRRRPLECWEELVVRAVRFGPPVELRNGPRLELANVKAVIAEPAHEPAAVLREYGFSLDAFHQYQRAMLSAALPEDASYTYGNRLRGYYPQGNGERDTLQSVIETLRANPQSRHAHISLWDTARDLPAAAHGEHPSGPCLVTLAFRCRGETLALTATYRAHNLLIAWLENVYGLMALQRHVADALALKPGPITVISHSLGIDPRNSRYGLARTIEAGWKRDEDHDLETGKYSLRQDPNGYFVVSLDEGAACIVAEHRFGGVTLKRYTGRRANGIAAEIAGDMAVSLVSHALWLGAELALKEASLIELEQASHA